LYQPAEDVDYRLTNGREIEPKLSVILTRGIDFHEFDEVTNDVIERHKTLSMIT
jgi:hypothetical protein